MTGPKEKNRKFRFSVTKENVEDGRGRQVIVFRRTRVFLSLFLIYILFFIIFFFIKI